MNPPKPLTVNESESITLLEAVKIRKFEDGFMLGETISRDKIAGKTKRRAHELLTVDHSDPNLTVKYHHVQEYDRAGQPVGEPHEHVQAFPAKRRPPRP